VVEIKVRTLIRLHLYSFPITNLLINLIIYYAFRLVTTRSSSNPIEVRLISSKGIYESTTDELDELNSATIDISE
jgi:hypothetical protein